ncbi:MAG: amino acid ABC transporter substrate-binding protein [Candidatus Rokubacteria bacterium]|nr:amino acid ABC transporter substrate-binding protein [Candidatus Rokubacteria bacterium]
MSITRKALAVAFLAAVAPAVAPGAEAQPPLRIGTSISRSGAYAELSQTLHRGYGLCVKHTNERGGVLGRKLELVVDDDQSLAPRAVMIYEKLIAEEKVDAVLGPFSSPLTEAVADVVERHRMPMLATAAATTSIFRKGRRFVFMLVSPAEIYLEGLVDMAAQRGLRSIAILYEDTLLPRTIARATAELAKKRGITVVLVESYARDMTNFTALLTKVRALNPDVLATPGYFNDAVAIVQQLKTLDVNPRMFAVTSGGDLLKFSEILGRSAEFVYGSAHWQPELVTLRAGGLVPIARQYPGAREFVETYRKEFPGADLSYQTAQGYGGCQVFVEAVKRAGTLDRERLRDAILKLDVNTAFGTFKVDADGVQIGHKMLMYQWQDGKKVIVWPGEIAPSKPRFPMPPWSQRP